MATGTVERDAIEVAEELVGRISGDEAREIREAGQTARRRALLDGRGDRDELAAIGRDAEREAVAVLVGRRGMVPAPIAGGAPEAPTKTPQSRPKASTPKGTTRLTLDINGTPYSLRGVPCPSAGAQRCYALRKADGTEYHVSQHATGCECTCGDWTFRRNGLDAHGCKHVRSLAAHGLLENHPAPLRGGPHDPFAGAPRREPATGHRR